MRESRSPQNPYYTSERAWLDHLRLMTELPYPSWALIPSIVSVVKHHLKADVFNFGWSEPDALRPKAEWMNPVVDQAYCFFMANKDDVFQELSIRAMLERTDQSLPKRESAPAFDLKQLLGPNGVCWGASTPFAIGGNKLGLLSLYRRDSEGSYSDAEWNRLDEVGSILGQLDRETGFKDLPATQFGKAQTASVLLNLQGQIVSYSPEARERLFLSRQTGTTPPEWSRTDKQALPHAVQAAFDELVATESACDRRVQVLDFAWGRFEFTLEKMPIVSNDWDCVINVVIQHHEPLDVILARALWGWPLSPQEKRILIASTHNPSLAQMAEVLDISLGTLKGYINELQSRLEVASRQQLIDKILRSPAESLKLFDT